MKTFVMMPEGKSAVATIVKSSCEMWFSCADEGRDMCSRLHLWLGDWFLLGSRHDSQSDDDNDHPSFAVNH